MIKRIISILLVSVSLLTLTACKREKPTTDQLAPSTYQQTAPSSDIDTVKDSYITKENAKLIALNHAGVKETDIHGLRVEFDRDDGVDSYEIDFISSKVEYEYDVHAKTGEILNSEKERAD